MRKVAVYGQVYKKEQQEYINMLFHQLDTKDVSIVVDEDFAKAIADAGFNFINNYPTYNGVKDLDDSFTAVITLGGDGTILQALTLIKDAAIPVLGINLGRLGFLATVQKEEIKAAVKAFLKGEYTVQERALLNFETNATNDFGDLNFALNDVTVTKKNTASMIGVETYLNDEYLTTYCADGLIISTPSGSTGYSLSCQGPVVMPNSQNFIITPIAPHNLNARPIVIPDDTVIKLKVLRREDVFLTSLDARVSTLDVETEIVINKADFTAKIIQLNNKTFLNTLRSKLLWGEDTRNAPLNKG